MKITTAESLVNPWEAGRRRARNWEICRAAHSRAVEYEPSRQAGGGKLAGVFAVLKQGEKPAESVDPTAES